MLMMRLNQTESTIEGQGTFTSIVATSDGLILPFFIRLNEIVQGKKRKEKKRQCTRRFRFVSSVFWIFSFVSLSKKANERK